MTATSSAPVESGLIVLDKPAGWTSHQVVGRVRRLVGTRKVGHAGTLDPMATGVLVVGVNRATRLLGHLLLSDKAYAATIRLGVTTVTDDAEGEVVAATGATDLAEDRLGAAVSALTGPIQQIPSSVSAIKVDGVRSYSRVRAGEDVALTARPVVVSRFEVLARRAGVAAGVSVLDLDVLVECTTGTYVRALARDLGDALGCGAHLAGLVRTVVGRFTLAAASTLAELEALEPPVRKTRLVGLEQLVADWPRATITTTAASRFRQGAAVATCDVSTDRGPGQLLAVFADGRLIGLGRLEPPAGPPAEAPGGPPGDHAAAAIDARPLLAPTRVLV